MIIKKLLHNNSITFSQCFTSFGFIITVRKKDGGTVDEVRQNSLSPLWNCFPEAVWIVVDLPERLMAFTICHSSLYVCWRSQAFPCCIGRLRMVPMSRRCPLKLYSCFCTQSVVAYVDTLSCCLFL